jgi:asparagine synthase (glutamine-hydrolysing)
MCGFAGIFELSGQRNIDPIRLSEMSNSIFFRGPDDGGIFNEGGVGFCFRRLSIIDVSIAGHQPLFSDDKRYTMVFNGEIYNYAEFYPELKSKGYKFHSKSDSEVLLYMFMEYGEKMLDRLNGMFAFCIWDKMNMELFIARDRNGVKPIYYAISNGEFIFSSEPKAIYKAGVNFEINSENISEWLMFRYISGEKTIHKNIKKLLPGHFIKIKDSQIKIKRWYNLSERILNHPEIKQPDSWFMNTFRSALNYRMVSDVPVGVLLSGGLDSSSVAAMLKEEQFNNLHTFNVGFGDFVYDESKIAGRLSKELGYQYHTKQFTGNELREAIVQSTIALDEPIMHANEPQIYAISKYAQQHVKVLISGEGADEILSGYVRYEPLKRHFLGKSTSLFLQLLPDAIKTTRFKKLQRYFQNTQSNDRVIFNGCNYFKDDLNAIISDGFEIDLGYRSKMFKEAKALYPNNPSRQVLYLDQHTYLQSLNDRNDRSTMRASIECREPFQDYRLAEGIGSLENEVLFRNGLTKSLLRLNMKGILPNYILNFKKIGFIAPLKMYINEDEIMKNSFNGFQNSPIFELEVFNRIDRNALFTKPEFYQLKQQIWFFHLWFKYQNNGQIF